MKDKMQALINLHDQSVAYMNELDFMKDEQSFLEHLLGAHFLELSTEPLYEITRKLIGKLKEVEDLGVQLIDDVKDFNKQIATSLEKETFETVSGLIQGQKSIQNDFESYTLKFKYVKKKIFKLIKEIMIAHKQKRLINKT